MVRCKVCGIVYCLFNVGEGQFIVWLEQCQMFQCLCQCQQIVFVIVVQQLIGCVVELQLMLFGLGGQLVWQLCVFWCLVIDLDGVLSQGGELCGIFLGFGQFIFVNYQQQVVVQQVNQCGELFIDCCVGVVFWQD